MGEKEEKENNEKMQEKETKVIEQPIVEGSEVIKKAISKEEIQKHLLFPS